MEIEKERDVKDNWMWGGKLCDKWALPAVFFLMMCRAKNVCVFGNLKHRESKHDKE